jgi:hypothetical protein
MNPLLRNQEAAEVVAAAIDHRRIRGDWQIVEYVVMPTHGPLRMSIVRATAPIHLRSPLPPGEGRDEGALPAPSPHCPLPPSAPPGTLALSLKTKNAQSSSKNARSPTSTTSAPPGSPSPTKNSTRPTSPPTVGSHPSPTTTSSRSIWHELPTCSRVCPRLG